jgi:hypothetical protein
MTQIVELSRLYMLAMIDLVCIGLAVQILIGDPIAGEAVFVLVVLIDSRLGPIFWALAHVDPQLVVRRP